MRKLIKICGLTQQQNIEQINQLNPDLIGYIFYEKSKRYIPSIPKLDQSNLNGIKKVGVFVHASKEFILAKIQEFDLDYIQLHSDETPSNCAFFQSKNIKVIKAFSISKASDFQKTTPYEGYCTHFIFDTKTPLYGGSGETFSWELLKNYTGTTPFLLSGGINNQNITQALKLEHCQLVGFDINSGVEDSPGLKNIEKTQQIIKTIRHE
ncbi:phosphoribosylanthranilate isomerase [Myroides sp. LJL115]